MAEKIKKITKEAKTQKASTKDSMNNQMRNPKLEKVVLNCGGTAEKLEKALKLLKILTNRKIREVVSQKRIPTFGVRPGLKTGAMVTIRGNEKEALLKRLFGAVNNKIKQKQIQNNHFSFGIEEYLEIPDMEYQRDIGILGLDVTAVFSRAGKRVNLKKIKKGKTPKKQDVTKEEIIEYLTKLGINVE
jgi:large subunit ribosomal protein L5